VERVDISQALIVDPRDADRVLLLFEQNEWRLPGGRRRDGETLRETVVRETLERSGLAIEIERVVAIGEFIASESSVHSLYVIFGARVYAGDLDPEEGTAEYRWATLDEADWLVPWYPGGVRRLVEERESVYYAHEGFE